MKQRKIENKKQNQERVKRVKAIKSENEVEKSEQGI